MTSRSNALSSGEPAEVTVLGLGALSGGIPDDNALLGPVVPPEEITVSKLNVMPSQLGASLQSLTDFRLSQLYGYYGLEWSGGRLPYDKIWDRILNSTILAPFGLDNT